MTHVLCRTPLLTLRRFLFGHPPVLIGGRPWWRGGGGGATLHLVPSWVTDLLLFLSSNSEREMVFVCSWLTPCASPSQVFLNLWCGLVELGFDRQLLLKPSRGMYQTQPANHQTRPLLKGRGQGDLKDCVDVFGEFHQQAQHVVWRSQLLLHLHHSSKHAACFRSRFNLHIMKNIDACVKLAHP